MVSAGMRRYRVRTALQSSLVAPPGSGLIDLDALLPALAGAPTRLDVGAGHGEFIAALAQAHPQERCLAVEHDRLRVTKIAHKCIRAGAANVRVFEDEAHGFVRERLPPGSLHRCYVLFPDPWPKLAHRRRRLLTRSFLIDCAWALAPRGQLIVASDVVEYALSCLSQLTTMPGCWRNLLGQNGCSFAAHSRFPTVFERHGAREGRRAALLRIERTAHSPPPRAGWRGRAEPGGYAPSAGDSA
jgi:tRNA (guanine-N7-)-methyltransferase